MIRKNYYLCVFNSRSHTLFVYNLFEKEGKDIFQLVATPCVLRTGCGYAIKFSHKGYIDLISKKVEENNLPTPKFYLVDNIRSNTKYKEL